MKISINGHHFDTDKASHHWDLDWFDQNSNRHTGDVYRSSKGQWYVYTPSQWSNMHYWELMSVSEILSNYDEYLEDDEKAEIAELGGVEWE